MQIKAKLKRQNHFADGERNQRKEHKLFANRATGNS
jgi:hypothetical protein